MDQIGIPLAWQSSDSIILINPHYSVAEKKRFNMILEKAVDWPGHVWLSTSGSSAPKWVGLSKQAVLASAAAVNKHLESHKEDCWIHALPFFHVGGLGIWARAYLSGATVCDFKQAYPGKWQPEAFCDFVKQMRGTLTSLVPTQLYDLVYLKKPAPPTLRGVIIGGGALLPALYEQAVALGWPLLPSYGLTECASQVATAPLGSWKELKMPPLRLLSHVQACEQNERLCFAGPSLLSVYAYLDGQQVHFFDPKNKGWLISEDRGCIQGGEVKIMGRADAVVKVGGESVDLARLENLLHSLRLQLGIAEEMTLAAIPDCRLGHHLHLVTTLSPAVSLDVLVQRFQQLVLPFERIRKISFVEHLPRTDLGKMIKQELIALVLQSKTKDV